MTDMTWGAVLEPDTGKRNLGEWFKQLFELTPALAPESLEQVFRIRHEVYCRDLGWEPVRLDGRETDEYDRHSLHCLLKRRDNGEAVGCTRLILVRPENPSFPLPFENSCVLTLDRSLVDPARMDRYTLGEVSRLAVLSRYRQRRGEGSVAASVTEEDFGARGPNSRFPFIPVSLYLGAAAMARRASIEHVFVLTEPRLASHFSRIGFDIQTVGSAIEHRGTRVPSMLNSRKVIAGLHPMIRPLYDVIEQAVDEAFSAHPDAWSWVRRTDGE